MSVEDGKSRDATGMCLAQSTECGELGVHSASVLPLVRVVAIQEQGFATHQLPISVVQTVWAQDRSSLLVIRKSIVEQLTLGDNGALTATAHPPVQEVAKGGQEYVVMRLEVVLDQEMKNNPVTTTSNVNLFLNGKRGHNGLHVRQLAQAVLDAYKPDLGTARPVLIVTALVRRTRRGTVMAALPTIHGDSGVHGRHAPRHAKEECRAGPGSVSQ